MKLQFFKFAFAVLVAALSPTLVFALDFTVDGMYFKVINDDEVAIANYYGTVEYVGDIVIPETVVYEGETYRVTAIADNAFSGQNSLTSVNTGHSVKSIGKYAFDACESLSSIYLGSAVEQIHEMAIMNCNQLLSRCIPTTRSLTHERIVMRLLRRLQTRWYGLAWDLLFPLR